MWAPSDGVLARVAFPRIRTFDRSAMPPRSEHPAAPGGLAAVDLAAIRAALAGRWERDRGRARLLAMVNSSEAWTWTGASGNGSANPRVRAENGEDEALAALNPAAPE